MTKDPAFQKLINVLGLEKAQAVIDETLQRIGRPALLTPDDRYLFACELMTRGGLLEAVGRSIKIQAILHGASER
jgi:hypothetical protein